MCVCVYVPSVVIPSVNMYLNSLWLSYLSERKKDFSPSSNLGFSNARAPENRNLFVDERISVLSLAKEKGGWRHSAPRRYIIRQKMSFVRSNLGYSYREEISDGKTPLGLLQSGDTLNIA